MWAASRKSKYNFKIREQGASWYSRDGSFILYTCIFIKLSGWEGPGFMIERVGMNINKTKEAQIKVDREAKENKSTKPFQNHISLVRLF